MSETHNMENTMNDYISYAIPTNSDHWSDELETIPPAFFWRVQAELTEFVAQHWPGVEFDINLVPETMSFNNRTTSSLTVEDEEDMIATIDNWMSDRWPTWLEESLG